MKVFVSYRLMTMICSRNFNVVYRRRFIFLPALMTFVGGLAFPQPQPLQPSPTPNETLKSPEVAGDGRVMFRIFAPNAKEVKLQAEGPEATPGMTSDYERKYMGGQLMTKEENGVWSFTLGPIQPGVYRYNFVVDGVVTVDPRNPNTSESLNAVKSMYEVPGATFLEYKTSLPHGAVATVFYESAAVGGLRRMHVYTPPGYEKNNQAYPVLYLLHGGGDTDDSWPTVGRAGAILDNLIASQRTTPMIIVMPAGHVARDFQLRTGMNTMGHDKFNEDLAGSVVPYIDSHYRTKANRQNRALAGLSMGGLQALTLSLVNSELFSYIGIFSSGWFPQMREQIEKTDLAQYKAKGQPFKLYWVGVGKLDIAHDNSAATVILLEKYGIRTQAHESEGFHAWNNWRDYLALWVPQIFK